VCHLAIKVEKQLKGRKSIHPSLTRSPLTHNDLEALPPQVKAIDEDKRIAIEPSKWLE